LRYIFKSPKEADDHVTVAHKPEGVSRWG